MTAATSPAANSGETRFTASVRALMAAQRVSATEICELLHISRGTYHNRLNDSGWELRDSLRLAEFFSVPLTAMIEGIGLKSTRPYVARKLAASRDKDVRTDAARRHLQVVRPASTP